MSFAKKYLLFLIIVCIVFFVGKVGAQDSTIENKIQEYQQKLTDIRQQKNTLSNQIQQMDTQISLPDFKYKIPKRKSSRHKTK